MTAINVNALGNIDQVNQMVQLKGTKEASTKEEFEKVMKSKAANLNGSNGLKAEENIKQPAKRTEIKKDGMVKAKNLDKQKQTEVLKKDSDVQEVAEEIIAGAAQILNVTPEELKAAMDSLEFDVADLTDRNNVAQLILMLNGSTDISDMLVNSEMLGEFTKLNGFIEETLTEAGITPEDLKAYMENAEQIPSEDMVKPVVAENIKPEIEKEIPEDTAEEAVTTENAVKAPEITIVKQEEETGASLTGRQETQETREERPVGNETVNVVEGFVRNLEMAVEQTGEAENVPDVREIVYQVVERIKVDISPDNTSLEMQLNPENLGRVSINITSKAGVMTAQINTENRQAREAIESQLQVLKENIEAKGIRVEAVEVRISDFHFADSKNSDSSSRESQQNDNGNGRRNSGNGIGSVEGTEEITEAQRIAREVLANEGSTVSYMA